MFQGCLFARFGAHCRGRGRVKSLLYIFGIAKALPFVPRLEPFEVNTLADYIDLRFVKKAD